MGGNNPPPVVPDADQQKILDALHRFHPLWLSWARLVREAGLPEKDGRRAIGLLVQSGSIVSASVLGTGSSPVQMCRRRGDEGSAAMAGSKAHYKARGKG